MRKAGGPDAKYADRASRRSDPGLQQGATATAEILDDLRRHLAGANLPLAGRRAEVAEQLQEQIDNLGRLPRMFKRINHAMAAQSEDQMRTILEGLIAALLSPAA